MLINGTEIDDTFAEAFPMRFVRMVITAADEFWLDAALREFCGDSASVIACDAEIGIERRLAPAETPDGRVGAAVLVFGFSTEALAKAVPRRTGQCIMTCPTTAVFDGWPAAEKRLACGKHIRFFGDGYQKSKLINNRRYWRIPVMDGEFLVIDELGLGQGVAGGNIILQAARASAALAAARRASEALARFPGIITPFPGGVARSGSKVGSRYKSLRASTADAYCPTLRGRVPSQLHPEANCAYEIVIDGVDEQAVASAMWAGIQAAAAPDVVRISAGNYGGKLGKYQFQLRSLSGSSVPAPPAVQ